jgi:hypothetical protein
MKAQEMFEKLGYVVEHRKKIGYANDEYVIYHKNIDYAQAFVFSKVNKTFWTCSYADIDKVSGEIYGVFPEEHSAIHQQMKELGWIE